MSTTANETLAALYPAHLDIVRSRYDEALAATGYDSIAIGAGAEIVHFLDDQTYPFRPNPHILQWAPLMHHPESVLLYRPGETPRLLIHRPDDVWHSPPDLPGTPWSVHIDVRSMPKPEDIDATLKKLGGSIAWLGDPAQWRHDPPRSDRNPQKLLTFLHFFRPSRTAYEVECIRIATARAIPGHRAAKQAFDAGGSEYDILLAFLASTRATENELPYPAIVAKNTHGAVLHYQHYDREPGRNDSLLIDAGCGCNGYASDITRTYGHEAAGEFVDLIAGLDEVQRGLVALVSPGKPFGELHVAAHAAIGKLLQSSGIIDTPVDDPVEAGITDAFFPHGLGHFLGLQVHEVGGSFADTTGTEIARPDRYPNLRLVRTLETNQVLTIEPGLYFIDTLLKKLKSESAGRFIDWKKVERLKKFGGIRIEDNILVTEHGNENLTRLAFDA